jgi:hypothetical protein
MIIEEIPSGMFPVVGAAFLRRKVGVSVAHTAVPTGEEY